jgi:hypothetical protein
MLGRILFDNDFAQRLDIEATANRVHAVAYAGRRANRELRHDVRELEDDVGVLALACRTMMRILIEKGVMTRDELAAAMNAIDAHDGTTDGRWTGSVDAP